MVQICFEKLCYFLYYSCKPVNYTIYLKHYITVAFEYNHNFVTTKFLKMSSLPAFYKAIIPFDFQTTRDIASDDTAPDQKGRIPSLQATKTSNNQFVRFTSALAHEVRNPLTSINLSLEMLYSATMDPELRPYLDIIMRGSMRINQLINELLKYQDKAETQAGRYSLHQLLDEALSITEERIILKKIRVRKEYSTEEDLIYVDKEKVRIAMANIIINAIESMSYKKGELTLTTRAFGKKFAVEITDNGTGISKEGLENIFRPYFSDKPAGTDPGLSTTLEILQYNHIGVDVSSEEGQGTSFILFVEKV